MSIGIFKFVLLMTLSFGSHKYDKKKEIELSNYKGLDKEVFQKAMEGYRICRGKGILKNDSVLTIINFTKSSVQERLYVINLKRKQIVLKSLVAHGKNSGIEFATDFSNRKHSSQSSLGFYVTENTYYGKHGLSLRMIGLEKGVNDNAYDRAIVIHSANYATEDFIKKHGRLGRSLGCPAVPPKVSKKLINTIKDGSLVFIYHENNNNIAKISPVFISLRKHNYLFLIILITSVLGLILILTRVFIRKPAK